MSDKCEKDKLPKKKTRMVVLFFMLVLLCLSVFYAYIFFNGKMDEDSLKDGFKGGQILDQNENEEKKIKMSEYDCNKNPKKGYVKIEGNIVRPDWLDPQKKLVAIVDSEVYWVNQDENFCVFAPPKTDIISIAPGDEWEKPILLFALVANKDKKITVDVQSTAVALVFKGTQSSWQQDSLEDSIVAFNHIQQDENIKKLAEAISRGSNFTAENITDDDSEVANAYQQSINSLEAKRRPTPEAKKKLSLIVILSPVDLHQDSESVYYINGKIETVENISPELTSFEVISNSIKEGNQLGVFFDVNKLSFPEDGLNQGYNEKKVKIKAFFESTTGLFMAEELSIL